MAKVLRAFDYSFDGVKALKAKIGDDIDFGDMTSGLVAEGYVAISEPADAAPVAPEPPVAAEPEPTPVVPEPEEPAVEPAVAEVVAPEPVVEAAVEEVTPTVEPKRKRK